MSKIAYRDLIKHKSFQILFSASFLSGVAQSMAVITIIWYIYQKTNNPWFIAISLISLELPSMIFAPLWGVFLDKYKINTLMIYANLSRGLLFVFLIFMPLNTTLNFIIFFSLLALSSSLAPIVKVGESMVLYRVVPKENLLAANSLMNIQFDLTYIIGPMIGGMIATTDLGNTSFLINATLFITASLLYIFIKEGWINSSNNQNSNKGKFSNWINQIKEGFIFILSDKIIGSLVFLNFFWNFLIWGTSPTLMPILAKNVEGIGSTGYGMLMASSSFGIIIGSILVGIYKIKIKPINIVLISTCLHGISYTLMGIPLNIYYYLSIFALAGFISAPAMIYNRTVMQLLVPEEKQGRVFTLIGTAGALGYPLGTIVATQTVTMVGTNKIGIIFVIFGGILAFITLLTKILMKEKNNKAYYINKKISNGGT